MEAPAGVEYGSVSEWRRSPAEPVTLLTGFTNPSLRPARPKSDKSDAEACLRRRSGHDEALPKSGRISALAGRQGRLRACYSKLSATLLTATQELVTTSIIKSDVVPGLRPGAASLFSGGSRLRCCRCARSAVLIVFYVVTIFSRQRPLRSDGTNLCSLRTGADASPLQGRAFSGACPQVRRRTGYIFI